MKRVMIIGGGSDGAAIAAKLMALGLEAVDSAQQFRALVEALPSDLPEPRMLVEAAPKFSNDRPYLKKKKGRS